MNLVTESEYLFPKILDLTAQDTFCNVDNIPHFLNQTSFIA